VGGGIENCKMFQLKSPGMILDWFRATASAAFRPLELLELLLPALHLSA
jgi:hypothetical protein